MNAFDTRQIEDELGDGSDFGVTGEWWGSDPRPNLCDILAAEWSQQDVGEHLKRLARKVVWQRRVKAFCLAVAVFCIVYFPLRLLVAFL